MKLPNTLELRTTFTDTAAANALCLAVTGPPGMVVPVGGTCQAQAASGSLPHTVFVPADGTPTANGTAFLAAAAALTGNIDRPHKLRRDDGDYDVGATTLNLSGIVLEGRSTDNTILTGSGSAAFSQTQGGTPRTDSDVRNLTVKNTGGNTYAAGIVFVGTVGRITDVNVNVSDGTNACGVTNAFGDVIVRGVRVSATATAKSVAFVNDLGGLGALSKIYDSKFVGSSSAFNQGEGLRST